MSSEDEFMWQPDKDPLAIEEEIYIKPEPIDSIKEEIKNSIDIGDETDKIDQGLDFNNLPFSSEPNFAGIKKIINVEDLIKSETCTSKEVKDINITEVAPTMPVSEISMKKKELCNCMLFISHCCTECKTITNYNRNKTQCCKCKALLKLECRKCHNRYKFLSSTHQYALQLSKRINLHSNVKKRIEIKYKKQQQYYCSNCLFKTDNEKLLHEHLKNIHGNVKDFNNTNIEMENTNGDSNSDTNAEINKLIQRYCFQCNKTVTDFSSIHIILNDTCTECCKRTHYQCILCLKTYAIYKNIAHHVKLQCHFNKNVQKFFCEHCGFRTVSKINIKHHIAKYHSPEKHNTNSDNTITTDKNIFMQNNELHNNSSFQKLLKKACSFRNQSQRIIKDDSLNKYLVLSPECDAKDFIQYYCLYCKGTSSNNLNVKHSQCLKCKTEYYYQCILCKCVFEAYCNVSNHVKKTCELRKKVLQCTMCSYVNSNKYYIQSHIRNKHTIFKCLGCNCKCEGYIALRKHEEFICKSEDSTIHNNMQVQKLIGLYCKKCGKSSRKLNIKASEICGKCITSLSFQCLKCNQLFQDLNITYNHVKKDCKPNFHCDKCSFSAYLASELDTHIKYVHNSKTCIDCGKTFKTENLFRQHRVLEIQKKKIKTI